MTSRPDITAIVIFHHEGALVLPALASLRDLVDTARSTGLVVEARAVLDRADTLTRELVATRGDFLSGVDEVSFGDAGLTRNAGVSFAHGRFLAFLDGDDLWGADWLRLAHAAATAPGAPDDAIWHPESIYYFNAADFDCHSIDEVPHPGAHGFHMTLCSSDASCFDRNALFMNNVWTANTFARRELYQRYPYAAADPDRGAGIEDWEWNLATLWAGIPHLVVADTVHLLRVKATGSLGDEHIAMGLLPRLPAGAVPRPRTGP
jgi:hypothetical protein